MVIVELKICPGEMWKESTMFSWYMSPFLCQEPLHGRNFTFWEWFYSILKLTKDWLHGPWKERSDILHFLQKQIQLCNTNHSDFCSKVEFILLSEIYCQGFFCHLLALRCLSACRHWFINHHRCLCCLLVPSRPNTFITFSLFIDFCFSVIFTYGRYSWLSVIFFLTSVVSYHIFRGILASQMPTTCPLWLCTEMTLWLFCASDWSTALSASSWLRSGWWGVRVARFYFVSVIQNLAASPLHGLQRIPKVIFVAVLWHGCSRL